MNQLNEKICSTCNLLNPIDSFRAGRHQCRDCRYNVQKQKYSTDRHCLGCNIFKIKNQFPVASSTCKQCKILYEKERLVKIKNDPILNKQRLYRDNDLASKRYIKREIKFDNSPIDICYVDFLSRLIKNAKSRSKQEKISWNLDLQFIIDLYHKQNGKCALTDITFNLNKYGKKRAFAPSIDRINCNNGYSKDNVRIVCLIVNLALNDFGDEAFKIMCNGFNNKTQ